MSTRAIIHFHRDGDAGVDGDILCTLYRHFDGYIDAPGLGAALHGMLRGRLLSNGWTYGPGLSKTGPTTERVFNRMGCLAACIIGWLKDAKWGDVSMVAAGTEDCWEEYVYHVYAIPRPKTNLPRKMEERSSRLEDNPCIEADIGILVLHVGMGITVYDGPVDGFDPVQASKDLSELLDILYDDGEG